MSLILGNANTVQMFTFGTGKTWAETATVTTAEQTVTVPGLAVGDMVFVSKPTAQAGLGVCGVRVSAADTLAITFNNPTAGGLTATAEEQWLGIVFKGAQPVPTNAVI
ncbi:MAG: hypothetical protein GY861_14695 [bacterium]|nr:hypothetical protein [bacterium]